jgi:hypothetical protein
MYETSSVHFHNIPIFSITERKGTTRVKIQSGNRWNAPITAIEDGIYAMFCTKGVAWADFSYCWGASKLTRRGYTTPFTHMGDREFYQLMENPLDSMPQPGVDYEVAEED